MFDNEFYALKVLGLDVVGYAIFIDIHADDIVFVGAED
jgi:hypothetical protein